MVVILGYSTWETVKTGIRRWTEGSDSANVSIATSTAISIDGIKDRLIVESSVVPAYAPASAPPPASAGGGSAKGSSAAKGFTFGGGGKAKRGSSPGPRASPVPETVGGEASHRD